MVGFCNFLVRDTRPDIIFPSSVFSRFFTNPSLYYIKEIRRVLQYLLGTIYYSIYLGNSIDLEDSDDFYEYSDTNYIDTDKTEWKLTSRYVFFFIRGVILSIVKC